MAGVYRYATSAMTIRSIFSVSAAVITTVAGRGLFLLMASELGEKREDKGIEGEAKGADAETIRSRELNPTGRPL